MRSTLEDSIRENKSSPHPQVSRKQTEHKWWHECRRKTTSGNNCVEKSIVYIISFWPIERLQKRFGNLWANNCWFCPNNFSKEIVQCFTAPTFIVTISRASTKVLIQLTVLDTSYHWREQLYTKGIECEVQTASPLNPFLKFCSPPPTTLIKWEEGITYGLLVCQPLKLENA